VIGSPLKACGDDKRGRAIYVAAVLSMHPTISEPQIHLD